MKTFLILFTLLMTSCSQVQKIIGEKTSGLSKEQLAQGLKETLMQGASDSILKTSKKDGYFKNPSIFIPFPKKAEKIKKALESFGMNHLIHQFETSLNRAAEDASALAKPIFMNAISKMTIDDAMSLIKGGENSATDYLKKATYLDLFKAFKPKVASSLNQTSATRHWRDIVSRYNQIPFTQKLNPELESYATEKALDGLFLEISKEESLIRKDPLKRTTDLMKKIFNL